MVFSKGFFSQFETFGFQNSPGEHIPEPPKGGVLKKFAALRLGDFLASYPPVIYDYPADKIFGYIPVFIECGVLAPFSHRGSFSLSPNQTQSCCPI